MILLATEVLDSKAGQATFGGLDVTVGRYPLGNQAHSPETDLEVVGLESPIHVIFI